MEKLEKIKISVITDENKVIGTVEVTIDAIKRIKELHGVDVVNDVALALLNEIERIVEQSKNK